MTRERSAAVSGDKLVDTLEAHVDFAELSKRALGDEWAKLDKAKQQEVVSTMRSLLKATWLQKLLSGDRNEATKFGAETLADDGATVETLVDIGGDTLPVVYHLRKSGTGWKIYDIVTDGASLIDLYRGEFKKQLAKGGYDGLMKTLKAKVAQQQQATKPATATAATR
ncbi:MAG: ABC transporter substrate-binding protein [Myxococcaceae bacterium]|nr:ABC transporter substrate-binding protein [Myxococcaceae bacterium]